MSHKPIDKPTLPAHEVAARQRRKATDTPKVGSTEKRRLVPVGTRGKAAKAPAPVTVPSNRGSNGRFVRKYEQ